MCASGRLRRAEGVGEDKREDNETPVRHARKQEGDSHERVCTRVDLGGLRFFCEYFHQSIHGHKDHKLAQLRTLHGKLVLVRIVSLYNRNRKWPAFLFNGANGCSMCAEHTPPQTRFRVWQAHS